MIYFGGKKKIAKYICPILQDYIDKNNVTVYREPFVGGANIIDKISCRERLASDINPYLISLYVYLQQGGKLYDTISKEFYDEVKTSYKNQDNKFAPWQYGNVGFLASYDAKFFDGYAKDSISRKYYQGRKRMVEKQRLSLLDISFFVEDYSDINPSGNEVIYCDPPYAGTTPYCGYRNFNSEKFWNKMREWSKNNYVIISEKEAPEDFKCIWEKETKIDMSYKKTAVEKLFVYKES